MKFLHAILVSLSLLCSIGSTFAAPPKQSLASSTSYPPVTLTNVQGSYYSSALNALITVDTGAGKIGYTPLVPKATYGWYSGMTLPPGQSYNLYTGASAPSNGMIGYDDSGCIGICARGNMRLIYLGVLSTTSYNNIDQAYLSTFAAQAQYTNTNPIFAGIPPVGAVFAVYNGFYQASSPFHYAKFQVTAVGAGNVLTISSTWYALQSRYIVLGAGYNQPQHITLSSDGKTAYVSESGTGQVLKVPFFTTVGSMNRASAIVVGTVTNPRQLSLDESTNSLYVIENALSGAIKRIDLSGVNPISIVANGFNRGIGLLATSDHSTFYVSTQGAPASLVKVAVGSGVVTPLITSGLNTPSFLSWLDDTQTHVLIPQASVGTNSIISFRLSNNIGYQLFIPSQTQVADVQFVSNGIYTVTSPTEIAIYNTASFASSGPLLLGIGLIPVSAISSGLATTAAGYMLQVSNSPFGGNLAMMINHDAARKLGATKYTLKIDATTVSDTWGDYKWNSGTNQFVYTNAATVPASGISPAGFAVRAAGDIWYNYWLGGFINTAGVSNGLHTLTVTFWIPSGGSWISQSGSVQVMIDNTWPTAIINGIDYYPSYINDANIGVPSPVPTCGIVQGNTDAFGFNITAMDGDAHLLSYALNVVWGDNKGASIASGTSAAVTWSGITNTHLPTSPLVWHAKVDGDISSYQCAHTFTLSVWDRTINGYGYIHYAQYTRSITLMLTV